MDFDAQFQSYVAQVERGIDELLPPAATRPARLHEAMRYSMQAGGKRLRPVLVLATADLFGRTADPRSARSADALPAAIAIECVHTYSLVHDDLPCMDNDDLRRGRPTVHKQFDEATALLAGDALLTYAFQLVSEHYPATTCGALVRELAAAAGSRELIGGQMDDLLAEKRSDISHADLEAIHRRKTGAMIEAALAMGGLAGGAREADHLNTLHLVGRHMGLAFQIVDDILDATADTATLGKTAGKDAKADKTTYVKLHGLDAARRLAADQTAAALAALARLPGNTAFLVELIRHMADRRK
ncbi:MAG: polyprenyl synthetase family protein [Candidatus Didemnitutus sp.]|nr:polyprenyl synthetase family protein [Candidatus Didemnitutus sp.]